MWPCSPQSMGLNQSQPPVRLELIDVTYYIHKLYTIRNIRWRDTFPSLSPIEPGSNNRRPAVSSVIRQISGSGASRQLSIVETVISYQQWTRSVVSSVRSWNIFLSSWLTGRYCYNATLGLICELWKVVSQGFSWLVGPGLSKYLS